MPYNEFWYDRGTTLTGDKRTSLIIEPADGRLPPLAPGAREQIGSAGEDLPERRPVRYRAGGIGADGPEDRGLGERCLLGFNSGPPMLPSAYNNNVMLFQTPAYVVILKRDGARRAHCAPGWPSACTGHDPAVDGGRAWPLGR